jgi:hypothetical protein
VDGRRFSLEGAEYVRQVIRDTSPKIVVKKAAQTRFTITFLVRTFHWIIQRRMHHLYLLPLKTGAVPFVQSRIDPIIDSHESINRQFKSVDNRLHKQTISDVKLLIRGTNVESELQETPVDVVVFDEFDRMVPDWLEDAKHRTDGSMWKRLTYLSTPTEPGMGLDAEDEWHASDQHHWEVPCPGCGRFQTFFLDENVKIGKDKDDCVLECIFCKRVISDHERKELNKLGHWEARNLNGKFRGYFINQFHSPTMTLSGIMEGYFLGQSDIKKLKSFFNQSLGEPYAAKGDKLTVELLNSCIDKNHKMGGIPSGQVAIGIDVGHDEIYVKCDAITRSGQRLLWNIFHFRDTGAKSAWEMLDDKVLSRLTNWTAVCDAHPDKRGARSLSLKYPGKFWLGFEMDRPQTEAVADFHRLERGEAGKVVIDRTLAFDSVQHEYMTGQIVLPLEAPALGEEMPRKSYNGFYYQLIQQVRVEEENTKGIIVARWKKNKNADHWHHADMFCFTASLKKPRLAIPANIGNAMRGAGSVAA